MPKPLSPLAKKPRRKTAPKPKLTSSRSTAPHQLPGDSKPERRRLVGLMTLLMSDRTGSPPHRKLALATPQVSIILNYEEMLAQAKRFCGYFLRNSTFSRRSRSRTMQLRNLSGGAQRQEPASRSRAAPNACIPRPSAVQFGQPTEAVPTLGAACPQNGAKLIIWMPGKRADEQISKSAGLSCLIHHTGRHCGLFHQ